MNALQKLVFDASLSPQVAESGGGHNQKGVDFQRYWSLSRTFELEVQGSPDYLLLFESVQDVVELDSETAPTSAKIYQVKKKDSGEWGWRELTALHSPPALKKDGTPKKKRTPKKSGPVPTFEGSPIGKLALSVRALSQLTSTAHFISNAGCAVPLGPAADCSVSVRATHL
jgi:hypothetical protein